MGADIHLFVEVKDEDNNWVMVDKPDVNRNYGLFEKMAGVRGELYNAMVQPRGLPDDVSTGAKLHHLYWEADAHTESYLNLPEIKELEKWINKQEYLGSMPFKYMFGNGFDLDDDSAHNTGIKDIRFVFWFDN